MKAWITIYNGGENYFATKELAYDYLMQRSKSEGKSLVRSKVDHADHIEFLDENDYFDNYYIMREIEILEAIPETFE
ncbi:MAG: hypothetical protein ACO376_03845 [Gammaproteobacteria bacterium]|jgi:hypothetical protein